ncbi:MAG: 50S ribosomal protein L11 methyltransferase [Dehalococcoidia bacterium]|nr:50S ribosomal protein L11 methyltransferase [Dehalococcoidia bacterium]
MATPADRWFEVVARCDPADTEAVADVLREAGAAGVSIEPVLLISDSADFSYEELTDRPWVVRATFPAVLSQPARRALRRRLAEVAVTGPLARLRMREVEPVDWAEEWKQFYRIQHIGQRLVVRPSWEPYEAQPHEVIIDLDPGAAFGTGEHETTRLCLLAMEGVIAPGMDVLDVGAGSGILAIGAAKLGARSVRAVDIDAATVAVAVENAERNGVDGMIEFGAGSVGDIWPWPAAPAEGSADLVLANISSVVLGRLMSLLVAALRPGGTLVASGFLRRDAHEVRAAAEQAGLVVLQDIEEGDWGALVATRA